jgi:hypothetical protein
MKKHQTIAEAVYNQISIVNLHILQTNYSINTRPLQKNWQKQQN